MSWECSGRLSESPWVGVPTLADKVSFLRSQKISLMSQRGRGTGISKENRSLLAKRRR